MTHYNKGSAAERELIELFFNHGFAVIRAAGSGTNVFSAPDLVALRSDLRFGIESKAWGSNNLSIPVVQFEDLVNWCKKGGCQALFAWKYPREGWFFLFPEAFHKTPKFYAVSKHQALQKKIDFGVLIGSQTILKK